MPLDYDGGDKMNSDVSANALEHAASAKAATSYADEWKDEVRTRDDFSLHHFPIATTLYTHSTLRPPSTRLRVTVP